MLSWQRIRQAHPRTTNRPYAVSTIKIPFHGSHETAHNEINLGRLCQLQSDFSNTPATSAEDTALVDNYAEFPKQQKRYQKLIIGKDPHSIAKDRKLPLKAADVAPA